MQKKPLILALLAGLALSGAAHATLIGRDLNGSIGSFEAYYDTDLDITWLANANVNGQKDWANAMVWAANLSFTDGVNTYDNWRLPTTLQPDSSCGLQIRGVSYGYNCTGSEMGHLFYSELGGTARLSILTSAYWSATEYAPGTGDAWSFSFSGGFQEEYGDGSQFYALAVSPGDVAVVPEAETYALMLAGLGLVGWRVRRRG